MKSFFSFILIFLYHLNCSLAQQNELNEIVLNEKAYYSRALKQSAAVLPNNYDLKYCRMNWLINPSIKFISGNIYYQFYHVDSLNEFKLEMSDSLVVDSIIMNGVVLNYIHSGNILTVDFNAYLPPLQMDALTIYYHGTPPATGFGSFAAETHGTNNTPVLWTLSEPYGCRDWWPAKQDLNDKIDSIDIFVTTPAIYKVASNGTLESEIINGLNKITHWKHRYPITSYLVAIAVSDYTVFTNQAVLSNGNLEVVNYVYNESLNAAQFGVDEMIDHLVYFDSLFGPYPFMSEKYGHAQFNWGGGMEHQTMSFVGNFSYELLAHELAHQWFGNHVTCGSWQDLWLNEGFATYATGLCYERFSPNLYWKIWKANQVDFISSSPDGSVFVTDTMNIPRLFDARLTYSKAAMVLHMLRWKIGDDHFFTALRNYQNNPLLSHNYARNIDLKNELEQASGQNLDEFFNDWYFGQGYPSYQLSYDQNSSHLISFTLSQSQSHSSVSFFEMPVPIKFKNSSNDTTIVFEHNFSGQNFSAQLGFKVDSVLIDPTNWIVCNQNTITHANDLINGVDQVKLYPNPAKDQVTLNFNGLLDLSDNALSVKLFAIDGKQISINNYSLLLNNNSNNLLLDISQLLAGTYNITITTQKQVFNTYLVKY
jgi:aminopeptidase N